LNCKISIDHVIEALSVTNTKMSTRCKINSDNKKNIYNKDSKYIETKNVYIQFLFVFREKIGEYILKYELFWIL